MSGAYDFLHKAGYEPQLTLHEAGGPSSMPQLILGIETSCDETAAAVYDTCERRILSNCLYSQVSLHKAFGGVVPEVASRSHVEKIDLVVQAALDQAAVTIEDVDMIAVTQGPGLVGSLLVGICFAKGLALVHNKRLLGINHHEGHIFSALLDQNGVVCSEPKFPMICMSVSGGHTSVFVARGFNDIELVGQTIDDAAGEAFDKISKLLGLGYPGGPIIEKLASQVGFEDFFHYSRPKDHISCNFSFSGLKTSVLYSLVEQGAYELGVGIVSEKMTSTLRQQVASSLQVCLGDIFEMKLKIALKKYPEVVGVSFVGGVACNKYLRDRIQDVCIKRNMFFVAPPPKFCTDNGAMIALTAAFHAERGEESNLYLDVYRRGIAT